MSAMVAFAGAAIIFFILLAGSWAERRYGDAPDRPPGDAD